MAAKETFKDRLTKKVGPLPVYAWAVLAVGGYLLYSHYRSAAANTATTPTVADTTGTAGTATDTSGTAGGGSAGSTPTDSGSTGTSDLLTQLLLGQAAQTQELNALTAQQTATSPFVGTSSANPSLAGTVIDPATGTNVNQAGYPTNTSYADLGVTPAAIVSSQVQAPQVSSAQVHPVTEKPFGGVSSTRKLKNGATLTTYGSGRQVEQAPGKAPYVVKK